MSGEETPEAGPWVPLVIDGATYARLFRALVAVNEGRPGGPKALERALISALHGEREQVLHDLCDTIVPESGPLS